MLMCPFQRPKGSLKSIIHDIWPVNVERSISEENMTLVELLPNGQSCFHSGIGWTWTRAVAGAGILQRQGGRASGGRGRVITAFLRNFLASPLPLAVEL